MNEQNSQQNSKTNSSTIIWIVISVILAIIIIILLAGGGVYLWLTTQKNILDKNIQLPTSSLLDELDSSATTNQSDDQSKNNNSSTNSNQPQKDSELTSVDSIWDLYTNHKFGFSIKVPKQFYHFYGAACSFDNNSYRPQGALVPTKIFEGPDSVYISSEYFYNLSGETIQDYVYYYSQCTAITNNYSTLETYLYPQQQSWRFVIESAANDSELESFLQDRYGSGCSLGDQEPTSQAGVFDVKILGDGKDLGETACPLNYATEVRYYPAKNKVIAWDLGQAFTFAVDADYMDAYDLQMVDSFRFVD